MGSLPYCRRLLQWNSRKLVWRDCDPQ